MVQVNDNIFLSVSDNDKKTSFPFLQEYVRKAVAMNNTQEEIPDCRSESTPVYENL